MNDLRLKIFVKFIFGNLGCLGSGCWVENENAKRLRSGLML
jgi:hypothetical protein